ncbi:hypothetical protein E4U17_005789 [Claviceps sp. LM77 group G4]|nr:hypothetical protein E4U17_005789 [Claviceps sp. LM77 group G4]KAG6065677.1 hypothetical protein E4U33_005786 [Claviceps sp. LM78 group G4]KAG6074247.1 hypothetical protein E4U16_004114 [Claviceps sp. LM84 group G4]
MKFSTVLGTFALSALETYHAYASPLVQVSPGAQSLEARNTEYCCVTSTIGGHSVAGYVLWNGQPTSVRTFGGCILTFTQTAKPPSQGGCADWTPSWSYFCGFLRIPPVAAVAPAKDCQPVKGERGEERKED